MLLNHSIWWEVRKLPICWAAPEQTLNFTNEDWWHIKQQILQDSEQSNCLPNRCHHFNILEDAITQLFPVDTTNKIKESNNTHRILRIICLKTSYNINPANWNTYSMKDCMSTSMGLPTIQQYATQVSCQVCTETWVPLLLSKDGHCHNQCFSQHS